MSDEIARYADVAMYHAEPDPTAEAGFVHPTVTLVSQTPDPLRVMAAACELYRGRMIRDPAYVSQKLAMDWLEDMTRTKLNAGFEFIDFHFLFEGVTRALTHQLVRQRTAVFVQESQRFAVKDNAQWEVARPPSLDGLPMDAAWAREWEKAVAGVTESYHRLINAGMPAEDARSLLPTNITTKVHYKTNLRGLLDHASMRLCSQAQYEWKLVWRGIVHAILNYGPVENQWQQTAITKLFKPVCYLTGKCEFLAETDRFCTIRSRVMDHTAKGEPPEEWLDIDPHEPITEGAARLAPEMRDET